MGKKKKFFLFGLLAAGVGAVGAVLSRKKGEPTAEEGPETTTTPFEERQLGGGVSDQLLEILACPACDDRPPVYLLEDKWLICFQCGRRYPIYDGIPVMLVEEGDKFRDERLAGLEPPAERKIPAGWLEEKGIQLETAAGEAEGEAEAAEAAEGAEEGGQEGS